MKAIGPFRLAESSYSEEVAISAVIDTAMYAGFPSLWARDCIFKQVNSV